MKRLVVYLKFVEIQTKVASVLPFLIGLAYIFYKDVPFNGINAMLMCVALLCIDLCTTGLNHYMDYKKAILKHGYHYEVHNPLGKGELSERSARNFLFGLLALGIVLGLVLAVRTDILFLLLGMMGFGVGIVYSFGPVPLSRTFLGEVFSGLFMGVFIPLITFYSSAYILEPVYIEISGSLLYITLDWMLFLPLIWLSIPLALLIAGIMLANNTCDRDEDIINKRYTLPVMIGLPLSLRLYQMLVIFAFVSVLIGVAFSILPLPFLIVLAITPKVFEMTRTFVKHPSKKATFINAVKIFVLTALFLLLGLILSIILK